ncbi:hypothetical protein BLS_000527 [Venturia inaequalis]|uniref:3-oxoacyl-[acyl-carrier-protein] reductase n=1 Tax=Venturia inaequalis TaxID=5025 RepID=A0A8H3VD75_VENIN|nr:hypothetical protein BLS_000527 [Venturia inaequalis]
MSKSRTAIVTGSARGIGKSIALRLAQDGYDVCVNDVSANQAGIDEVVKEIQATGRKATGCVADISILSDVEKLVQHSVSELGPLDTMIANAGIAQVKALLDLTEQDLKRMFEVNVYGVITAFKPFPLLSHYSASKWAVRGLTQAFAMEMAEHKITVNAYAPGIVGTAMWDLIDEELAKKSGAKKGEMIKKYVTELTAMGRTSVPEDVSKVVSFLSGPDSDFMTGQTVVVDGGIVYT